MSGPVLSSLTIRTGWKKQWPARRPSLSAEPSRQTKPKDSGQPSGAGGQLNKRTQLPATRGGRSLGGGGRWAMNEQSQLAWRWEVNKANYTRVSGNGRELRGASALAEPS